MMMNTMMMMQMGRQGGSPPWFIVNELKRDFTVREIQPPVEKIDADINVLLVVHPKELPERAQFALDQFVLRGGKLVAFLDLAYQGFGQGITEDGLAVQKFVASGEDFFVSTSFSKSLSLYGERGGALSIVCADAEEAARVLGQMKATIRRNYSSPPMHGGQIVAKVLTDPKLRAMWEGEVQEMRERIQSMRRELHDVLVARIPGRDFGYFLTQRGMFSYTGLTAAQAERLKTEFGVYILRSGRMCVAGLNTRNVEATAEAMAAVLA